MTQISGQNAENMNKYTENMRTLGSYFKESFKKGKTSAVGVATGKVTKLTKPVFGNMYQTIRDMDQGK